MPVYFDTPSVNRSGVVSQEAALICNPHGDPPIAISWQTASTTLHSKTDRSAPHHTGRSALHGKTNRSPLNHTQQTDRSAIHYTASQAGQLYTAQYE